MGRSPFCDDNGLKKGPWTPEEDQKLVRYIQKHGHRSWRALPKLAGLNRCGKSCRLRWTNYLRPDIKRGKFSQEEEQTILHLHSILGNKWSAIATHLPGRTDNEIKNFWNTHLKKKLIQMGFDPMTHQPRIDPFSSLPHLMALANLRDLIQLDHHDQNHNLSRLQFLQSLLLLQYSTSASSTYGNVDHDHIMEPYFADIMNSLNSVQIPLRENNQVYSQDLPQCENNLASLLFSSSSAQPLHHNPTLLSPDHLDTQVPFSSSSSATNSQLQSDLMIHGSTSTGHDEMGHQGNDYNSNYTLMVSQADSPPDHDSPWLFLPPLSPYSNNNNNNNNNNNVMPPNFMSTDQHEKSTSKDTNIPGDHASSSTSSYGGPSSTSTSYWLEIFLDDDSNVLHEIIS